jgi:hypothetical protein
MSEERDPMQDEELEGSDEVEGHKLPLRGPEDPGWRIGHSDEEDDEVEAHKLPLRGPEDPGARQ